MCFAYSINAHFLWNDFQFLGYFTFWYNLWDGDQIWDWKSEEVEVILDDVWNICKILAAEKIQMSTKNKE